LLAEVSDSKGQRNNVVLVICMLPFQDRRVIGQSCVMVRINSNNPCPWYKELKHTNNQDQMDTEKKSWWDEHEGGKDDGKIQHVHREERPEPVSSFDFA